MTSALKPNTEPIPGYQVTERLGTGGYGEVWKAEAPGGLQKAIKFIYGYLSDEKASRELKALNRIKQIRHPFLLSLERIEVVDGQLLIVTELADASLKDRFVACKDAGLTGVPREELLAHLRDAADALDFLSENVLQHLDVKPENLLFVGGRMKVADFGLVKDIHDHTCSMMGGMTPVYAAPELFDGRPCSNSDQYSLAIVYQEMLTGELPFPGATAAQLASQHLHSRPRLESLPSTDVEIIGKALAKDPKDRFSTSRAMIDALTTAERHNAASLDSLNSPHLEVDSRDTGSYSGLDTKPLLAGARQPAVGVSRGPMNRSAQSSRKSAPSTPSESRTKTAPRPAKADVLNLPPIDVKPQDTGLRPTLFLGIGGTAGHVLRRLRRRLHDRFGELANVPILQMLLIDTDVGALAPQSDSRAELNAAETLAMPLRKPQEYREDSLEILQWLSRRWLYNIPRSLKTEGLRPLGRLALVDHSNVLFDRLRQALSSITAPESIDKAQQMTGCGLRDSTPRVFVVSSISGGTGSGMVLDVAYSARMLLADMGLSDQGLCGVLVHSTQRNTSAKDLAVANAYACLSELCHYARQRYPGEPACGLRAFDHNPTFPRTYFVHLGDRLSEAQFLGATDALAEYLYLDAATLGGAFFDKCRAESAMPEAGNEIPLRTLGVCQLGCSQNDLPAALGEFLTKQLVERWAGGAAIAHPANKSPSPQAPDSADVLVSGMKLDMRSLVELFQAEFDKTCSDVTLSQLASALLREPAPPDNEPLERRWAGLVIRAKLALGLAPSPDDAVAPVVNLAAIADAAVGGKAEQFAAQLNQHVFAAADHPGSGLTAALSAGERVLERLRKTEADLTGLSRGLQDQISLRAASPQAAATGRRGSRRVDGSLEALSEELADALGLFVVQKSVESALRLVTALVHRLVRTSESIVCARRETLEMASGFDASAWNAEQTASEAAGSGVEYALRRELSERLPKIAAQLERQVKEQVVAPRGGLFGLLSGGNEDLRLLPALLRSLAHRAVVEDLKEIDIAKIVLGTDSNSPHENVRRCLQTAWPNALNCGGAQRLLVVLPDCPSAARLSEIVEQERSEKPTVLFDSDCDFIACYEGEQVGLSNVAAALSHNDPQCVEVARRLHTRVDVEWSAI